jgi:hypothetical protein
MRHLLIAAALLCSQAAHAAQVSVTTEGSPGYPALVRISGQFMDGVRGEDVTSFLRIAEDQRYGAVVYLDSKGGSITAAVEIGRAIRKYGFGQWWPTTRPSLRPDLARRQGEVYRPESAARLPRFQGHPRRHGFSDRQRDNRRLPLRDGHHGHTHHR